MLNQKAGSTKNILIVALAGILVLGGGIGVRFAIKASGQPSIPTNADGSIPIPADLITDFKTKTGEDLDQLDRDAKAIRTRQMKLSNFYIHLRMSTLAAAQIPANQYDWWQLDTEKRALVKLSQAQYDQLKKQQGQ
jgi:hypothetical protein